jgi:hypothetical protein
VREEEEEEDDDVVVVVIVVVDALLSMIDEKSLKFSVLFLWRPNATILEE